MRWLLIGIVLLANAAAIFLAFAPTLVTFAEVVPLGVNCASCSSPEVTATLSHAASVGRAQVIGVVSSYSWLLVAVACFNVTAVIAALFMPALTRRSSGTR
ncbi:hypothetical protein EV682_102333 [Iodobacter fluviatilis]|uniref:Uncharacterized protein n=1 Tax=Iodobacter fluviatilis TaxID=537 RepID=A0A377QAA7_9NEIS|nr:hypothetical protein EV682_102333 [Iodobacter fluviatilis]STQ90791.1 Uncharacterised protein [Iodobacter fluviatilis]